MTFTADEQALIEHRQGRVFSVLTADTHKPGLIRPCPTANTTGRGRTPLEPLQGPSEDLASGQWGFPADSLGRDPARDSVPMDYWAHNFSFDAYALVAGRLESYFYTTKTEGFDDSGAGALPGQVASGRFDCPGLLGCVQ